MPDGTPKTPAQELAVLFPHPRSVTIAGRVIEIKRCGLAQAGRLIDAAMPLYVEAGGNLTQINALAWFEDRPAEMNSIIVAATGLEAEWVAALDPLDKFAIASEWLDVNGAFFVQRLLPRFAVFMNAMAKMAGGGPTSSTSSSSTAT